jgi:hypothetical protein
MLASDLLGRTAHAPDGTPLGRIADLITGPDLRVTALLITPHRRGRLFGYERPGMQHPWLLEQFVRLLHRGTREIPLSQVRWPLTDEPG